MKKSDIKKYSCEANGCSHKAKKAWTFVTVGNAPGYEGIRAIRFTCSKNHAMQHLAHLVEQYKVRFSSFID